MDEVKRLAERDFLWNLFFSEGNSVLPKCPKTCSNEENRFNGV
jgi:hypothetical protein